MITSKKSMTVFSVCFLAAIYSCKKPAIRTLKSGLHSAKSNINAVSNSKTVIKTHSKKIKSFNKSFSYNIMQSLNAFIISLLLFVSFQSKILAQSSVQTLRGTVIDKISQSPLPGAVIVLLNATTTNATSSDAEGRFKLLNVPIGKQSIKISFLGYKEQIIQNLTINSGKELVLTVQMEEDIQAMNEVVVEAKIEKNKALNEFSAVSTRAFSVEETQKFAAAVNDPARMATSFAGVLQAGDGNNNISIRGNSPNGLLWRMEGVEIPNPNHFSAVGSSGGGISILSAQLLGNSDFSTGAFAAEYGNALSGVFDLKLRKGNNQKREYTFQAGVLGIDFATEGPFKKNYDGSYLINYRYSTLNILRDLGIELDGATTFQDLSFNMSLPTKNLGSFGIYGFGGISAQKVTAAKDSALWKENDFKQYNNNFVANTGAVGVNHVKLFNNQSYLKSALVFSGTQNKNITDKLLNDYSTFRQEGEEVYNQSKITLNSVYTKKVNARNNFRTGFIANQLNYGINKRDRIDTTVLITRINEKGNTQTIQTFFQWNTKVNEKLTTNIGLHYFQLLLNNTWSLEPRASIKYELNPKHNFTAGYGLHSQLQPIGVYFAKQALSDGTIIQPNKNLELSKAHHFVVGYDWNINSFSHIKTEVYYQHLFNVPISKDKTSTYSILNTMDGYNTEPLSNRGLGRNYGLELTYERFLHKNLYYLISASLYDSKYKAANDKWYNTRFNTNQALSVTIGKEWTLSEKRKNRVIGFNIKSIYMGGWRNTPIDLEQSKQKGEVVFNNDKTFTLKNPDYYRLDVRVSLKRNYKKLTTTLALDLQNATNRKNVGGQYFNVNAQQIQYFYQAPLIPILSYKLEF